ncbi:MAG: hypothetical protein XD64_0812 [Thermotoga sp. 47_83]|jgi:hypothetical protein|uniref:Uncharacterized protein n=1 Tax=Thermotoga petrophila TaxID=93929 RepID=A0A101EQ63_9THEM|nr:MAG: hypothetical protein XD57_1057 [Thermotoga petrophila]KUK33361.1 MAG: hypothetical protein XD64_0812 [Thermotoga sp. 47_83]MDK2898765.1 hypothetical protein [Thermotoga sp.]
MDLRFFGMVLILLGVLILLSVFNVFDVSFGKFLGIVFATLFGYAGISALVKKGFPNGLVSCAIATVLFLHIFNVHRFTFWEGFVVFFSVLLIEWGFFAILSHRD